MTVIAKALLVVLVLTLAGPILVRAATHSWARVPWYQADRGPSGLAPEPSTTPQAVVQIYAAPTYGWRGLLAVHSWIVVKPANGGHYTRFEVVGWGGGRVVRTGYGGPDDRWYGQMPELLLDLRGAGAAALIPKIEAAVATYPWPDRYRSFPGPNSNTFVAHVARSVPALGLDLPPTAIGKDYRPVAAPVGRAPSGGGLQVSLLGLAGLIVAPVEGIEVNILGLGLGVDVLDLALRIPGFGRIGN